MMLLMTAQLRLYLNYDCLLCKACLDMKETAGVGKNNVRVGGGASVGE